MYEAENQRIYTRVEEHSLNKHLARGSSDAREKQNLQTQRKDTVQQGHQADYLYA